MIMQKDLVLMNKYAFERQVNQDLFYHILSDVIDDLHDASFENETFIIRAYNWDTEEDVAPNFEHKPSGFKMWWYKYPLRSPEVNINISHEQFSCILYDCKNSITASEDKHPKIYVEIDKWWE